MNREIKYKIWNRKAKDWWNWWTEETYNLKALITGNFEPFTKEDAEECLIPLQYTGLDDKNNVPIYEGDIGKGEKGDLWLVFYSSQTASFMAENKTADKQYTLDLDGIVYTDGLKIVGNKFEDRNLIEK